MNETFELYTAIKTIQKIISCFENGTIVLNYAYCDNIGDGRGYTCGIAGWTTADGDYQNIVSKYPPLAKFSTKSTLLLKVRGFVSAWVNAAKDPNFRVLQDHTQFNEYFQPAIDAGKLHNVTTALGQLILCDIAIQHGMEDDSPSSPGLLTMLKTAVGKNETDFLLNLLIIRRSVLTRNGSVWKESIGRVDVLQNLIHEGNFTLKTPFVINPFGDTFNIV